MARRQFTCCCPRSSRQGIETRFNSHHDGRHTITRQTKSIGGRILQRHRRCRLCVNRRLEATVIWHAILIPILIGFVGIAIDLCRRDWRRRPWHFRTPHPGLHGDQFEFQRRQHGRPEDRRLARRSDPTDLRAWGGCQRSWPAVRGSLRDGAQRGLRLKPRNKDSKVPSRKGLTGSQLCCVRHEDLRVPRKNPGTTLRTPTPAT